MFKSFASLRETNGLKAWRLKTNHITHFTFNLPLRLCEKQLVFQLRGLKTNNPYSNNLRFSAWNKWFASFARLKTNHIAHFTINLPLHLWEKQLVYQLRALNNKPYHTIHIQSISASPRFQSAEAGETYSCLCTRFLIIPPLVSRILLMTINADLSIFSISALSLLTSKRVITV